MVWYYNYLDRSNDANNKYVLWNNHQDVLWKQ